MSTINAEMNDLPQASQLKFLVRGLELAAQAWGNPAAKPVLALHGWLDNSASFAAIAPHLNDIYLVSLDLPGHGHSGHRPGAFTYNIWEDIPDIFAVADALGWQTFSLLGHSRGAIIAALAAGTFPDRIERLALIEGLLPEPVYAVDAPKHLALSIQDSYKVLEKQRSVYSSLEIAIRAREKGMFPLSYEAARLLTERGVQAVQGGFCWRNDPILLVPSAVKLLPEQFSAFIARISAPVTLILGNEGMPKLYPRYVAILDRYPQIRIHKLAGGHHLHLEKQAADVAAWLNPFFNEQIK